MLQLMKHPAAIRAPVSHLASMNFSSNPQKLPHYPVPKLNDTLEKFLISAEPHLPSEKFAATQKLVKSFESGIGAKLQNLLEIRGSSKENWLSDWWLQSAYLEYRDPVIVWSSPGLIFPQKKFLTEDDKVIYCAKVISGALSYKQLIDKKELKTDFVGKFPLDMQQYDKIFGTCRIPGLKKDTLTFSPNSKHIVVIANDNFFKVTVYGLNGNMLSEMEIIQQLKICLQEANKLKSSKVGILTSDNRDNWGAAYNELIKIDHNRRALELIQESLFTVSFDREMPQSKDGDDIVTASHQLIHGGGSQYNSANRWYDKTVQFIVGTTGINGLTYEHSPAEGQPIAVLTDFVVNYLKENKVINLENAGVSESPMLLDFETTPQVEASIQTAAQNVDKLGKDLDMNYLCFKDYGKNFIKAQKLSPDSFVQMAIQLAFYRLHKQPGAHYESAQTRIYVHGRTETIRSCSKESIAFAKAMCEGKNDQDKLQKLRAAINSHKSYASMAIQGFGVDRHLLGLKLIAKENNIPLPELYQDDGYIKSAHMRLSTSQVASRFEAFMCYGPLTQDGYGCCYNPRNDDMLFGISSLHSCNETSSAMFKKSLEESLKSMAELLVRVGEPLKSKL